MNHLSNYMKSRDVKSLYLYTDTKYNYGFYDSQNFERINEKKFILIQFRKNLMYFYTVIILDLVQEIYEIWTY